MAENKQKHTFVLSDQSEKNGLGIIVLTAPIEGTSYKGIVIDDFISNPVMLLNHNSGIVLGKWTDPHVDKSQKDVPLLATAEFDEADEDGKKYSGKVDRGYVKGASAWLTFDYKDIRMDVPGFENKMVLTNSILREASIAPVPENRNALKLTDSTGKELTKDAVIKLSSELKNENHNTMTNKLLIALVAATSLKLSATSTEDDGIAAVKNMITENERLSEENKTLKLNATAQQEKACADLVQGAIDAGKILPKQKEHYLKLAKTDFDSTKSILDAMKGRVSLSSKIENKVTGEQNPEDRSNWSFKDWSQKDSKGLLQMKADRKEEYDALVAGVRKELENKGAIES